MSVNQEVADAVDYGFNDKDLTNIPGTAVEAVTAATEPTLNLVEPPLRDTDLRADVREPQVQPAEPETQATTPRAQVKPASFTKKEKIKWGVIVGGGGLIVFGFLAYLAWGVIHPSKAPVRLKTYDFEEHNTNVRSVTSEPQLGETEKADLTHKKRVVQNEETQPAVAVTPESLAVAPVRTSPEDDDAFYDNLAKVAGQQPAPTVSTVTPQEVKLDGSASSAVPTRDNSAQFIAMSQDMKSSKEQMERLMEAVNQLNTVVVSLKTQVENDSKQSAKYGAQIASISDSLTNLTAKSDERFKAITDVAVAAAIAAVKKQGTSGGNNNGKMVLVGGPKIPTKAPEKPVQKENQARTIATVAAPQIAPVRTPAISSAAAPAQAQQNANQAPSCGAKTISQNWNVKGVSTSAAYIRRTDGEGIMVRADMEVPGFGIVKSFDPNSRTVCTTSGLIVR